MLYLVIGINADCQKELIALNGILNKQALLIILKAEDSLKHVLLLRMAQSVSKKQVRMFIQKLCILLVRFI